MRVLLVFCVNEIGGAEAVLLNLVRFRSHPGLEYSAAILADTGGSLGERLSELGVPWRVVPRGRMRSPGALIRACAALRGVIRELGADVILANAPQGMLYSRCAAAGLNVPVALYYMTVPRRRLWENGPLDVMLALSRPRLVFTASKTIGEYLGGWGLRNVHPVYHGTPVSQVLDVEVQRVEDILTEHGVGPSDPVILLPGRLQPWKGQHVLVEAMPEILQAHPDAHAVLLGGTLFGQSRDYPAVLRQEIEARSLESRVHLVGHDAKVGPWLSRATVVVHASTEPDPFPNVCIEAMAARRPLITNSISGTAEVVEPGRDALVIPPSDSAALADAVVAMLQDSSLRERLGERGHDRYLSTCTPQHMAEPIERELGRLLAISGC